MSATIDTLRRMDAVLARAGHHPLSQWWLSEVERFYTNPTAREWIARVGRGGAKSTALVKLAVNEVLFGDFAVPPGERHYFAFVSIRADEAAQRLRLIESYLDALGVRHQRVGDVIELDSVPRGFRVFPCTVGAVSGFRCIGWAADEASKWRNADNSANPAREVIPSMRAMTVPHPQARGGMFSSPFGTLDLHYDSIERGDTSRQIVSIAPTWVANPSITEEQTRELEPDTRVWSREYAAEPQAAELAAFDEDAVKRAFQPVPDGAQLYPRALVLDPSSGRKDSWTWCTAGWAQIDPLPRPVLVVDDLDAVVGKFWKTLSGAEVVERIAALAHRRGIRHVHSDQREAFMLQSEVERHKLAFHVHDWTGPSKATAVEWLRRLFAESAIILPVGADRLRRELCAFEEKITAAGALTFGGRGSGHDDFVSLLLTAGMVDAAGDLPKGDGLKMRRPWDWRHSHRQPSDAAYTWRALLRGKRGF